MVETKNDYISQRPEIIRELFLDARLEETGLPFDRQTLAEGIGEVGLAGYYLQHDVRRAPPPATLLPILKNAPEVVRTTLERHNRMLKSTTPPRARRSLPS